MVGALDVHQGRNSTQVITPGAPAITEAEFKRLRRDGLEEAELAELLAWAGAVALLINLTRALGAAEAAE